jgi:hypothetical protein
MSPEWLSPVCYPPLDQIQIDQLQTLRDTVDLEDEEAIDTAFHNACYVLYAHERHLYAVSEALNKFFSPVNLFLVFMSMLPNGNFRPAGEITGSCAAFEYSIRTVMLVEVDCISKLDHVNTFKCVFLYPSIIFDSNPPLIGHWKDYGNTCKRITRPQCLSSSMPIAF